MPPVRRLAGIATTIIAVLIIAVLIALPAVEKPPEPTVTVQLDGRDAGHRPDAGDPVMKVPAADVHAAAASELGDHTDLATSAPPGVTAQQVEQANDQADALARDDQLPIVAPDAAPSQAGCRSRFIGNYSSRGGTAPRLIVWHYTVSPNSLGWGDVDGVSAFLARPATKASANYVIDREGHCNYIVREVDKAWAQTTYNRVSVSIENVNTGREPNLTSGAGERRLLAVTRAIGERWHIPMRLGQVDNRTCTVTRGGIVTHQMLGACGGGHVDISPYPVAPYIAKLVPPAVTGVDRVTCRKLTWWRAHGRANGKAEANAVRRRRALERRHMTCTSRGPVRT